MKWLLPNSPTLVACAGTGERVGMPTFGVYAAVTKPSPAPAPISETVARHPSAIRHVPTPGDGSEDSDIICTCMPFSCVISGRSTEGSCG